MVKPFVPNAPFLYPLKTSENRQIFRCFQRVEKGCIENKWIKIKANINTFQSNPSKHFNVVSTFLLVDATSRRGTTSYQRWNNVVYFNVEIYNVESTLTWTTLDNVKTTLPFSTSSFLTLVNVETTLRKKINSNRIPGIQSFNYYFIIFTCSPRSEGSMTKSPCKATKVLKRLWKILHCNYCKNLI